MKDMDVVVTYSLSPTSLYSFYTGYDITNHGISEKGQIELMASFIKRLITSAVNQSVDEYPALEVNSSLDRIQETIKQNLNLSLEKNNLAGKIDIDDAIDIRNVKNVKIASQLLKVRKKKKYSLQVQL
jgi:hypothetical protein